MGVVEDAVVCGPRAGASELTFVAEMKVAPPFGTLPFVWGGPVFLRGGWSDLRDRKAWMMPLISMGLLVAFGACVATMFHLIDVELWFELATLVTIMLLGQLARDARHRPSPGGGCPRQVAPVYLQTLPSTGTSTQFLVIEPFTLTEPPDVASTPVKVKVATKACASNWVTFSVPGAVGAGVKSALQSDNLRWPTS